MADNHQSTKGYFGPYKAAKEKSKTIGRKHWGVWEEKAIWQPNGLSSKVWGILEVHLPMGRTRCEPRCDVASGPHLEGIPLLQSSLYIGCRSGRKYCIDSLDHQNASKERYRCSRSSLQFEKDSNPQYFIDTLNAVYMFYEFHYHTSAFRFNSKSKNN